MTQTEVPISPGGVRLSGITVTGGYKDPPIVMATDALTPHQEFSFNPIPMLVVSVFHVNYTVENCGAGMTLLEGRYDQSNSSNVLVSRVQAGTPGLSGTFDLSFSGRSIRGLPADVSGSLLEELLEANFPEEGGVWFMPTSIWESLNQ